MPEVLIPKLSSQKEEKIMPHIHGLNKTTLLDYPGRVAATIFLGGCNFRCPFCQNSPLVLHPSTEPEISEEEVLNFLQKRTGILEGVCISGGEPTLSADLEPFVRKIHEMGYSVKLDTNGSHPEVLKNLAEKNLIQMAAVDIKAVRACDWRAFVPKFAAGKKGTEGNAPKKVLFDRRFQFGVGRRIFLLGGF